MTIDRVRMISSAGDIPPQYASTPIGLLLEYHNLGRAHEAYSNARLLIGMCMDNRKHLRIPDNFALCVAALGEPVVNCVDLHSEMETNRFRDGKTTASDFSAR